MQPTQRPTASSSPQLDTRRRVTRRGLVLGAGATAALVPALSAFGAPDPARVSGGAEGVALTRSGLYSWPYDYLSNRARIAALGTTTMRVAHDGMTDEAWEALAQDGYDAHITITGSNRSNFSDERSWIDAYLARVDGVLARWPFTWVEVWNEPNFGMWTGATAAQKQVAYGNLLVATYRHIKSRWPGVNVVGFGAGGASAAAAGFIRGVVGAVPEARDSFDACSLHPYFAPTAPEAVRKESWGSWTLRGQVDAIRKAGVSKPLWFTETGSQITKADGGRFAPVAAVTVSPYLQAAYAVRTFLHCMELGVSRLHHMYVIDTDNYNGGFFTATAVRPQATAVRVQQALLRNPTSIEVLANGEGGRFLRRVTSAAGTRFIAWSDQPGVNLEVGPGSLAVDVYGRLRPLALSGALRLESAPTYVQSPRLGRLYS